MLSLAGERHSAQHWQLTVEGLIRKQPLSFRFRAETALHNKPRYFQLKGLKEYLLLYPSSADPKGHYMSFIKHHNENTIQVSICNALFVETPTIYLTQPLSHQTWLSYSEISNYCNEILSERVKQYFLQFTHLDFLVNKLRGRWREHLAHRNRNAHVTKLSQVRGRLR